jgi:hypothetical protein
VEFSEVHIQDPAEPRPEWRTSRHSEKSLSLGAMVRMIVAMIVLLFTEVRGYGVLRSSRQISAAGIMSAGKLVRRKVRGRRSSYGMACRRNLL